jgi:hypothetical protein
MCVSCVCWLSLLFPLFNYNIIQEPFKYENLFILYQNASLVCVCASACATHESNPRVWGCGAMLFLFYEVKKN